MNVNETVMKLAKAYSFNMLGHIVTCSIANELTTLDETNFTKPHVDSIYERNGSFILSENVDTVNDPILPKVIEDCGWAIVKGTESGIVCKDTQIQAVSFCNALVIVEITLFKIECKKVNYHADMAMDSILSIVLPHVNRWVKCGDRYPKPLFSIPEVEYHGKYGNTEYNWFAAPLWIEALKNSPSILTRRYKQIVMQYA